MRLFLAILLLIINLLQLAFDYYIPSMLYGKHIEVKTTIEQIGFLSIFFYFIMLIMIIITSKSKLLNFLLGNAIFSAILFLFSLIICFIVGKSSILFFTPIFLLLVGILGLNINNLLSKI